MNTLRYFSLFPSLPTYFLMYVINPEKLSQITRLEMIKTVFVIACWLTVRGLHGRIYRLGE